MNGIDGTSKSHSEHLKETWIPAKAATRKPTKRAHTAKECRSEHSPNSSRRAPNWLRPRLLHRTGHRDPRSQTQGGWLHGHPNRGEYREARGMVAMSLRRSSSSSALRCPPRRQIGPFRQEHAGRPQSRARNRRKGASLGCWSLPSNRWADGPHGPDCARHGRRDGAWLHPRSATRRDRRRKAKGIYKGRPVTFDRARIVSCARKEWALLRSPRPSGASGETSIRRSRRWG